MKRLWVILFVIPLFAQEVEKSITLKKGENIIEIKPGDRVYVRYYKNLPNRDRSLNMLPGSFFFIRFKSGTKYLFIH